MAVFRIEKTKDYTVMANHHFKEKEMSLKAKGLLSLMLSLPDDWDYSIAGLVSLSKDGKDSVTAALDELERFGYLSRVMLKNEKGQFAGYDYIVSENPFTDCPQTEKPFAEKPITVNPISENPPQLNTKESNTKKIKYEKINKKEKLKKEKSSSSFPETEECKLDILEPEDKYPPLPPLSEYPF